MIRSIFGDEPSTIVTALIAFIVVIALIALTAWLVRRFGVSRLGGGRGRQPRLAVIDAAAVDSRRKLIIIRRDNVEHLLMIGGPSDVVVETNIMRTPAAQREATPARVDTLPRAVPLPDAANWPAQPEPAPAPRIDRPRLPEEPAPVSLPISPPASPPFGAPVPPPLAMTPRVEPQARPQPAADPLIGLAAELSRARHEAQPRLPEPTRIPLAASFATPETSIAPLAPIAPSMPPAPPLQAAPPLPPPAAVPAPSDAHLAEMAQRLESALRRPLASSTQPPAKRMESKPIPYAPGHTNGPTNGAQPGNGAPTRSIYEDLEQEMASLLGRQPGKS